MQCPDCSNNQKYTEGMKCLKCGYEFALDPKEEWGISDMAFINILEKVSSNGEQYFTCDQLRAAVYKTVSTKYNTGCLPMFGGLFMGVLTLFVMKGFLGISTIISVPSGILVAALIFFIFGSSQFKLPAHVPDTLISTYKKYHKIEKMIQGRMFNHLTADTVDKEFLDFAPERILIVAQDDMVDMLLMNRFHFDNKTLVLGESKYPGAAFAAYKNVISNYPDIPVMIVHDCSTDGLNMKKRLTASNDWSLQGREVIDLGLFPEVVQKKAGIMWLPRILGPEEEILSGGIAKDNLAGGYRVPLSILPSPKMLPFLTLATAGSLPLFTSEFFDEAKKESSGAFASGGFG